MCPQHNVSTTVDQPALSETVKSGAWDFSPFWSKLDSRKTSFIDRKHQQKSNCLISHMGFTYIHCQSFLLTELKLQLLPVSRLRSNGLHMGSGRGELSSQSCQEGAWFDYRLSARRRPRRSAETRRRRLGFTDRAPALFPLSPRRVERFLSVNKARR